MYLCCSRIRSWLMALVVLALLNQHSTVARAQPLGLPDRTAPGDQMIQAYLAQETAAIESKFAEDVKSLADWNARRSQYVAEYRYMLGLPDAMDNVTARTPLAPTITGSVQGEGYVVDLLHYQSLPGLYVTGNLYRPTQVPAGQKLPAVFYVCGHSGRGRNGNKVAYQSHGIWLARHGYVCLIVDTLQLGEIAALHHGTYNLQRWSWHSRGYSPAGVEAWNGVRGIDYLVSREDVDPSRIAVTGISGGGAVTFWIAAADERVRVAIPVSGMADLQAYVPNRVINGHCDCMFTYNTFRWPWTRIAGLVAPRPMLFMNSDQDAIFPMDANDRISNRMERMFSLFGASDQFDAVVSVGGHAYRKDLRQASFRFLNSHLNGDASPITDSEIDIVSEGNPPGKYPIPPESLRVFPADANLPLDQINQTIDEHFIPLANVAVPEMTGFPAWKKSLQTELRRVSFGYFPEVIPAAKKLADDSPDQEQLQTEDQIHIRLRYVTKPATSKTPAEARHMLLVVLNEDEVGTTPAWLQSVTTDNPTIVLCETRGIGATRWTRKNPPNYVERSHALLGRTVDTGRVWDIIAASSYLREKFTAGETKPKIEVAGRAASAILVGYAAALDEHIHGARILRPEATHLSNTAPQFLNVLRVCDIPDALGLIAPRPLMVVGSVGEGLTKTKDIYTAAGASDGLTMRSVPGE